jgi:hypothetical protein
VDPYGTVISYKVISSDDEIKAAFNSRGVVSYAIKTAFKGELADFPVGLRGDFVQLNSGLSWGIKSNGKVFGPNYDYAIDWRTISGLQFVTPDMSALLVKNGPTKDWILFLRMVTKTQGSIDLDRDNPKLFAEASGTAISKNTYEKYKNLLVRPPAKKKTGKRVKHTVANSSYIYLYINSTTAKEQGIKTNADLLKLIKDQDRRKTVENILKKATFTLGQGSLAALYSDTYKFGKGEDIVYKTFQ